MIIEIPVQLIYWMILSIGIFFTTVGIIATKYQDGFILMIIIGVVFLLIGLVAILNIDVRIVNTCNYNYTRSC